MMWSEVERLRSSVCQELQILCVVLIILVFHCVFIQLRTVVLNFQNVLQHNMTSAQIISRYFTHKKGTEKFRMNCCPIFKINEHSAWYQNVWILAVNGRFPVEYILVCCTLNTPVQSTKSVCEFETHLFLCWRLICALILIIFLL